MTFRRKLSWASASLAQRPPNIYAIARDGVRFDVELTPAPGTMARVLPAVYADAGRLQGLATDLDKASKSKDFNDLGLHALCELSLMH